MKPLPAPTRVTSKVSGTVLPMRVNWPSTLPWSGSVWRKAVETKVASGKALDFRNPSPASSRAKPGTLVAMEPVRTLAVSFEAAGSAGSQVRVPVTVSNRKML
jgi:hypothetical protein